MDEIDFPTVTYISEVLDDIGVCGFRATGGSDRFYYFAIHDQYGRHVFTFNSFDEAFIERQNFRNRLMEVR